MSGWRIEFITAYNSNSSFYGTKLASQPNMVLNDFLRGLFELTRTT
jgi:hypothetical protein